MHVSNLNCVIPSFLQNEKKKDAELTLRINKILKHRDNAVKGADISKCLCYSRFIEFTNEIHSHAEKIEASVDQTVIETTSYSLAEANEFSVNSSGISKRPVTNHCSR